MNKGGKDLPRANRYILPGHIWHITHRCHKQDFLLKFAFDRRAWLRWLFEAKKRYGLCILNYMATSNHIHLLVKDRGNNEIPKSMQLIAGRVAQEFNQRKKRKGAFWEDRYHATAIASDHHFARCLTYIDLNMVRAGVVDDPADWPESGYAELMQTRQRYHLLDHQVLEELLGVAVLSEMQATRRQWAEEAIRRDFLERDSCWSESLAVGNEEFVANIKAGLGIKGCNRRVTKEGQGYVLRESEADYAILPLEFPL
jgi:putative transposase